MEAPIICPRCGSEAFNKYGRICGGKQRYICLVCGRQFSSDSPQEKAEDRPPCPICGSPMHGYGYGDGFRRFRCSRYPKCRGYAKVWIEGEPTCHSNHRTRS
jgi:transposase-like protein